ncbi:hypothetical protein HN011_001710 [Eciton burchellii]|nr:hypothetical protein HN011_001710 [Eciton burchellii]
METGNKRGSSKPISKQKSLSNRNGKTLALNNVKYILRKKQSIGLRKSDKEIYVNNKTNFKGQLYKCEKFFDKGASELIIHGLGAAVYKACNLALRLKEIHYGTLEFDIKTSTVTLTDELETLDDDAEDKINNRQNSAIHIRVFRTLPVSKLRQTD